MAKRRFLAVCLYFLVTYCIAALSACGSSSTSTNTLTQPATNSTPIVLDGNAYLEEYANNAITSQAKYTGKLLQMTGQIHSLQANPYGDKQGYVVNIIPAGSRPFTGLLCFFTDIDLGKKA